MFLGEERGHPHGVTGWRIGAPLAVLAALAIIGGALQTPSLLGGIAIMPGILGGVFGANAHEAPLAVLPLLVASLVPLVGIALAWRWWGGGLTSRFETRFTDLLRNGWDFDRAYDRMIVQPLMWLVRVNRHDVIDSLYEGLGRLAGRAHAQLSLGENGRVRWYAGWLAAGSVAALAIAVLS